MIQTTFLIKEDRELTQLLFPLARKEIVNVVPTIGVELICNERNSQKELHLALAHALFELIDHFIGHEVTLLNRSTIGLQETRNHFFRIVPQIFHSAATRKGSHRYHAEAGKKRFCHVLHSFRSSGITPILFH